MGRACGSDVVLKAGKLCRGEQGGLWLAAPLILTHVVVWSLDRVTLPEDHTVFCHQQSA